MSIFKDAENFKETAVPSGRHTATVADVSHDEKLAWITLQVEAPGQPYDGKEVVSHYCSHLNFHLDKLCRDCKMLGLKSPVDLERQQSIAKIIGVRLRINVKYNLSNGKQFTNVDFISNETKRSQRKKLRVQDLQFDFSNNDNDKAGE